MFLDWLTFLYDDTLASYHSIEVSDLAYPSYIFLWLCILFTPLNRIDRQDPIAGLVYVLFSIATGATLFFGLPRNFTAFTDINIHFACLLAMGCIAAYRWFHGNDINTTKPKNQDQKGMNS